MSTRNIRIAGAAGTLEGTLTTSESGAQTPVLLLCHPHPQYGGSMHDAVLEAVESASAARVRACLRFNFRGVGDSDGTFDGGVGEVDDVVAAAQWLASEFPGSPLWLAGYSFGAAMAWRARSQLDVERIILIAPPMGAMRFDEAPIGKCAVHAIYGDADEYVDSKALAAWAATQLEATLHVISGCDHFFGGQHRALQRLLSALC